MPRTESGWRSKYKLIAANAPYRADFSHIIGGYMLDFIVIGAGVVGGLIARELSRYEAEVAIAERMTDVAMGATKANSAIVHAGFDAKEGTLKARLNVRGSELMERTASELGVKYKRNGSLVVGFNDEDRRTLESLLERGRRNGVRGLSLIGREEILSLEPNIGEGVTCALRAETGAIICPYELCISAVGNAMDNGARLELGFEVDKIEKTEHGYRVCAGDRVLEGRYVINCAGVFSDEISAMAGEGCFSITARRGEYLLLDKECGGLVGHTVFRCPSAMGKGVLVTPTVDGNLLLGPTAEDIPDKDDTSTTQHGTAGIKALASEQVDGINYGRVITSFTGLRATGSTGDFIIRSNGRGFIDVAGIESPGLSSAPAIAEYVADMLRAEGEVLRQKADYDPVRRPYHFFRELTDEQKNAVIAEEPEYAHTVCRCEGITAGEIIYAIRTNPRASDIDGVKRRTRATMGRCQGGFCTPYIAELLARELGIDICEVKKSGGGSYINIGRTK